MNGFQRNIFSAILLLPLLSILMTLNACMPSGDPGSSSGGGCGKPKSACSGCASGQTCDTSQTPPVCVNPTPPNNLTSGPVKGG